MSRAHTPCSHIGFNSIHLHFVCISLHVSAIALHTHCIDQCMNTNIWAYNMPSFILAAFPGHPQILSCSCGGTRLMHQVPLVTCILLCYTKITVNFCSPAERPHCRVILYIYKCLHHSLVIVHTESGQWPASFTREKSILGPGLVIVCQA